tara:strand:+ start:2561 stop:2779 length:219 start_codon:yes stop_codon:yes gene_type:complete
MRFDDDDDDAMWSKSFETPTTTIQKKSDVQRKRKKTNSRAPPFPSAGSGPYASTHKKNWRKKRGTFDLLSLS